MASISILSRPAPLILALRRQKRPANDVLISLAALESYTSAAVLPPSELATRRAGVVRYSGRQTPQIGRVAHSGPLAPLIRKTLVDLLWDPLGLAKLPLVGRLLSLPRIPAPDIPSSLALRPSKGGNVEPTNIASPIAGPRTTEARP